MVSELSSMHCRVSTRVKTYNVYYIIMHKTNGHLKLFRFVPGNRKMFVCFFKLYYTLCALYLIRYGKSVEEKKGKIYRKRGMTLISIQRYRYGRVRLME